MGICPSPLTTYSAVMRISFLESIFGNNDVQLLLESLPNLGRWKMSATSKTFSLGGGVYVNYLGLLSRSSFASAPY